MCLKEKILNFEILIKNLNKTSKDLEMEKKKEEKRANLAEQMIENFAQEYEVMKCKYPTFVFSDFFTLFFYSAEFIHILIKNCLGKIIFFKTL